MDRLSLAPLAGVASASDSDSDSDHRPPPQALARPTRFRRPSMALAIPLPKGCPSPAPRQDDDTTTASVSLTAFAQHSVDDNTASVPSLTKRGSITAASPAAPLASRSDSRRPASRAANSTKASSAASSSSSEYSDPSDEGGDGYGDYASNFLGIRTRQPGHFFAPTGNAAAGPPKKKPRTWDGVFLPVSLSIFGAVLFLRLPWCVGQAGLGLTLLGIACCYTLSGLTLISLAAISTNGIVSDGGPYMMVSRTLGPQIGLAVGALFIIANMIASSMYLIASAPAVTKAAGLPHATNFFSREKDYWAPVAVASGFAAFLLLVARLRIERWFRLICLVLTLLALADMVVFMASESRHGQNGFLGASLDTLKANMTPNFDEDVDFRTILAILLPGVTGMLAGTTLSGELRHASKAMPRGIFYAWASSLIVYILIACLVAASFDASMLRDLTIHAFEDDVHPYLFIPGLICACFAAVLAGIAGSAKVILGIVKDDLIPSISMAFFAKRPFGAVVFMWVGVQLLIFVGPSIYADASRYTAVVFCCIYFTLNLGTFLSEASGVTSFRPTYAFFNKFTAIIGAAGSVAMMFAVSPYAASASIVLLLVFIFSFEALHDPERVTWGDAAQPITFHLVRKWLLKLDVRKEHPQHWRPNILQIVASVQKSQNFIHFANNLKKGGLYVLAVGIKGDFVETRAACHAWKNVLLDYIRASGIKGFPSVTFAPTLRVAIQYLLRGCGLGGMRPNTVLLSLDEFVDRGNHYTVSMGASVAAASASHAAMSTDVGGHGGHHSQRGDRGLTGSRRGDLFSSTGGGTRMLDSVGRNTWCVAAPKSSKQLHSERAYGAEQIALHSEMPQPRASPTAVHPTPPNEPVAQYTTTPTSDRPQQPPMLDTTAAGCPDVDLGAPVVTVDDQAEPSSPKVGLRRRSSFRLHRSRTMAPAVSVLPPEDDGTPSTALAPAPAPKGAYRTRKRSQSIAAMHTALHHANSAGPSLLHSTGTRAETSPSSACIAMPSNDLPTTINTSTPLLTTTTSVFKTNRTDANEDAELAALEKMRQIRVMGSITDAADVMTFCDETEFGQLARDACSLQFSVLLGRNFDELDRDVIESRPKNAKAFIDLWLAEETDPVLFLTAHCLSLTSVWRTSARLRVVSVTWAVDSVHEVEKHVHSVLKHHRIAADVYVVPLERECGAVLDACAAALLALPEPARNRMTAAYGSGALEDVDAACSGTLVDLARDHNSGWVLRVTQGEQHEEHYARLQAAFRESLDRPSHRAIILNQLMKSEVARNGGRTALVMTRIEDPPSGSVTVGAAPALWTRNAQRLSEGLPPTVLFCGGGNMMLTQEW